MPGGDRNVDRTDAELELDGGEGRLVRIIRQTPQAKRPRLSIILLDWSVRESLHTLDYLAQQDVDRDEYEIVWIEYFNRESDDLKERISIAESVDEPSPVDTWIVMEMPGDVCHHKHLMYNVGILAARGELVCFCDSDAMFRPGFVSSIFDAFDRDSEIVLHHDQVRNHLTRLYPFQFPAYEQVTGYGCSQWVNGKPMGLWDEDDPLHTRNYGSSMTARRDDLIAIGGADMHLDYLGHVCGPYEMTFRLANYGRREVWDRNEFLYHTWHPGQSGTVDYCGPHDGLYMSTTALEAKHSGRVGPLVESPGIRAVRNGNHEPTDLRQSALSAIDPCWYTDWKESRVRELPAVEPAEKPKLNLWNWRRLTVWQRIRLLPTLAALCLRASQSDDDVVEVAVGSNTGLIAGMKNFCRKRIAGLVERFRRAKHQLRLCWVHLVHLDLRKARRVAVVGESLATRIIDRVSRSSGFNIRIDPAEPLRGEPSISYDIATLNDHDAILIASFGNSKPYREQLTRLGVEDSKIVEMQ